MSFLDSPSGKARVHYALTGPHAPPSASTLLDGVPDAVVVAARAADDALAKYVELSYAEPLSDGDTPCASNGGSDAVDIYLIDFTAADGQAVPEHCLAGTPRRCAAFVLVENDFARGGYADADEGMRTVVPHELFHTVQDAYDASVERWWAEGTAQWAAKQVYPDLKDLERFLPAYFDVPSRPLNVPPNGVIASFLYATAIWPVFLQERFDASLIHDVFEGFTSQQVGVLPTIDEVLSGRGSNLAHEFLEFAAYNAATGSRAPRTGGYRDPHGYPLVPVEAIDGSRGDLAADVTAGMAAYYYRIEPSAPSELSLVADPERLAALWLPLEDGKVQVDAAKPLPTSVDSEGIVVVAGQSLARTDAPFTLRGAAPSESPGDDESAAPSCALTLRSAVHGSHAVLAAFTLLLFLGRARAAFDRYASRRRDRR
ncbi:MAG TPA: MXAN_6640 family putative metalloprotease [Polyangiaceae bacterium]|nr:MXAN_6640 family putative metalloprotease [Polyangiaceae bacterium]